MKKVVRLTESDLIKIVKRILIEKDESVENKIKQTIGSLSSVDEIKNYLEELNQQYASDSKKLVLIFPGYGQYTVVATAVYLFGINAQVFTSINDCILVMNDLASKGKKYTQIYVGSHGGGYEGLLHSIDDDYNSTVFGGFSKALSRLTVPNQTKILFSACGGADITGFYMKKIAEETGSFVYGSEGNFNWIDNESEGGLWVCPPSPKTSDQAYTNKHWNGCKRADSAPFDWK